MAVNFTKNQHEITSAWQTVESAKSVSGWALFGYEGNTNNIKLVSTGTSGLQGLVQEFNCSSIQYAFCRVIDEKLSINKLVLINWQGDSAPLSRKGLCASHVGDVASYFKGCNQTITIRNDDEATVEYLMEQIAKTSSSRISVPKCISSNSSLDTDNSTAVGSTYKRVNIRSEISNDRKSFWERQEEEEKERLIEEKKRAAEKQAQFEKERKIREELEAKKLADAIKERDKLIEATRSANEKTATSSQPSSISSDSNITDNKDDDERVGRRSELIRLERNQETLSLISKGLIKNKRAFFEQASQNHSQTLSSTQATLANKKSSGSIVTQRLSTFKSLDNNQQDVENLTNGVAKTSLTEEVAPANLPTKKEEIVLTKEEVVTSETGETSPVVNNILTETHPDETHNNSSHSISQDKQPESPTTNGSLTSSSPRAGDNNQNDSKLSQKTDNSLGTNTTNDNGGEIIMNSKAKALYDYQAADNTEISFDPDDLIGFIEKVDSGWWHGSVLTGQYKGQSGLFPANYVEEL